MYYYSSPIDLFLLPDRLAIYGNAKSKRFYIDAIELHPEHSQKVRYCASHFDWGYIGQEPMQLALGILLRFLPVDIAMALYKAFTIYHVSKWEMLRNVDKIINLRSIVTDLLKMEELLA